MFGAYTRLDLMSSGRALEICSIDPSVLDFSNPTCLSLGSLPAERTNSLETSWAIRVAQTITVLSPTGCAREVITAFGTWGGFWGSRDGRDSQECDRDELSKLHFYCYNLSQSSLLYGKLRQSVVAL
jgi:hypothetical protein